MLTGGIPSSMVCVVVGVEIPQAVTINNKKEIEIIQNFFNIGLPLPNHITVNFPEREKPVGELLIFPLRLVADCDDLV